MDWSVKTVSDLILKKRAEGEFNWTEIGDARSPADLYYAGLSDVPEEWWER